MLNIQNSITQFDKNVNSSILVIFFFMTKTFFWNKPVSTYIRKRSSTKFYSSPEEIKLVYKIVKKQK